jgi:site-specific recombinase XerD
MTAELHPQQPARELEPGVISTGTLDLIAAFLLGYSEASTRGAYASDLRSFIGWTAGRGLDPLDAGRAEINLYARHLERDGYAKSTVARRLSVLSKFYEYAEAEDIIERHPMRGIQRPKVSVESQTLGLDKDQAVRLLDHAETAGPAAHALACLLMLNGLRVSEACELDVDSLRSQRGHSVITIHGKGGTITDAPLPPRSVRACEDAAGGRDHGPLLLHLGTRLDRFTAFRWVERLGRQVGAPGVTPHSLRHTFVTMALDAGMSLREVQRAARHKDPKTTIRYDRARRSLDGHAAYAVAQWLAGGE